MSRKGEPNVARLLRKLREDPPGRTGQWWEANRNRLVAALEKARAEVCAYGLSGEVTCDCKSGLIPGGGFDPPVISDEFTGCPELRRMIWALRRGEGYVRV